MIASPYPRAATATSLCLVSLLLCAASSAGRLAAQNPLFNVEDQAENPLFQVYDNGGLFALGALEDGQVPDLGPGVRLAWSPARAAFRAGRVAGDEWDHDNTGDYSVAMGLGTSASGRASVALGEGTAATAGWAIAVGRDAQATGTFSVAVGSSSGGGPIASGNGSMALGPRATASGLGSLAFGVLTEATGNFATVLGANTEAQSYQSLVLGQYNVVAGDQEQWVSTDPLLVAGNGSSSDPSNALTLLKNGDLTIAGSLTESSDIRLKTEIEPLEGVLEAILQLTPIRYRYRTGTGHPADPQLGLSAQEVRRVLPELVSEDAEGHLSVAYTDLAAVLVGAVQELEAENQALREELETLRAAVVDLLERMSDT